MRSSFGKVFMGAAGSGGPSDDEFNRVSFLSHFEGANNGVNNAFDDGSDSNHTITANGNATQGSFGPFARPDGEWGWNFDGTDDFLTVPDSTDFNIASDAAFTLELWAFYPSFATQSHFVDNRPANTQGLYLTCSIGGGGTDDGKVKFYTNSDFRIITASTVPLNSWVHIALVRSSGTTKIYINGTADNNTYSDTHAYISGDWIIGKRSYNAGSQTGGLFSNYRFVNGTAVYTSNFTPSTSKLTAITNTKLLTCQSNRFIDNSASGHTVTPSGGAAVSAFGPFLTNAVYDPAVNGASMECDGSGDYLSLAYDADFNFGTGSFTVEAFVFPKDLSGSQGIYATNGGEGGNPKFIIYLDGATPKAHVNGFGSSVFFNATATISANEWNHLAFVRNGSTWYWFVNGTQAGTGSNSTNITFNNVATTIGYGGESGNTPINGFISDLRVVKGTAVYTSNFTPPTAPVTAITNTKLLLNMADAQAIDSAAQNNLTLVGNAKISTGQAKFGDTSMVFDETGDYVILPTNSFKPFGTGNFTIECFARFATDPNGNGQGLFGLSSGYLNSASRGPAVGANNSNGRWAIYHGTTNLVHGSLVPSQNTWYHVAYVRNSGVTKLYIDGTEILSVSDTTNYTDKHFVFGGWYSTSYLLNGYIDEFRISHMARYTSNFTAPAEPFADKGQ